MTRVIAIGDGQFLMLDEECEPCYCGWTGLDDTGCTCLPKED